MLLSQNAPAVVPKTLLAECPSVAMPLQPAQESRNSHFSQGKLLLDIIILPQIKPIGGIGDGVMERKDIMRWTPLLEQFLNENAQLVSTDSTSTKSAVEDHF
jgi:hypothetical protein